MKKIIAIVSTFLLPTISFAQGYMMNTFNRGWENGCMNFGIGGGLLGAFFLLPLIGVIFAVCVFAFWVMMLVDAIKHAPEKNKLVWVVVIVFTHIIGALIYYFVEKRPKNKHDSGHTEHKAE